MHPEELRTWCHSSLVNVPFPSLSARVNIRRTLSGSWLSWLLYYCDNDYDQDFMIIAWSHTHTLHKLKVGTGTFCFAPFDFMDNSLVQLQAKKKHLQKRDLVFMLVSFSIVSFSLALCGRRPRTRGLFSPSSKRTLHQPFLTSPHQLECEAAFFHTQSQRKRRKGLYNVDFGFGSFSP